METPDPTIHYDAGQRAIPDADGQQDPTSLTDAQVAKVERTILASQVIDTFHLRTSLINAQAELAPTNPLI